MQRHEVTHPTPVGSLTGPSDSSYMVATSERERCISGSSADAALTCGPATNSCLCRVSASGLASGSCSQAEQPPELWDSNYKEKCWLGWQVEASCNVSTEVSTQSAMAEAQKMRTFLRAAARKLWKAGDQFCFSVSCGEGSRGIMKMTRMGWTAQRGGVTSAISMALTPSAHTST